MKQLRAGNYLILTGLLLITGIQVYMVKDEALSFSDACLPLVLALTGILTLVVRSRRYAVPVVCLLLAALAVYLSPAGPEYALHAHGWWALLITAFWRGMSLLFGFVFVHFALIFPVKVRFVAQHGWRVLWIYVPYAAGVIFHVTSPPQAVLGGADILLVLAVPIGFALGLFVFLRQFLYKLTDTEKNRLRTILIGCLAGALPFLISTSLRDLPDVLHNLAYLLLPLFPASLVVAVARTDFARHGALMHRALTWALVAGGTLTAFYLFQALVSDLVSGSSVAHLDLGLALGVALLLAVPLKRLSSSYLTRYALILPESEEGEAILSREFQLIRPNPFVVGNPIHGSNMFFGREAEFHFIRSKLESQAQGCVIVLYGERRMGKTSILYQVLNGRLGDVFIPVFVDMQEMVVQSDQEFLWEMTARIEKACRSTVNGQERRSASDSYLGFSNFMDRIHASLGSRRLVLLVDEYELIEQKTEAGILDPAIYGYFNALLERYPRLNFVFTGSHPLDPSSNWNVLLGKSFFREVAFLSPLDAEALIRQPLKGRVAFKAGVVRAIVRLTHGHPFYTQLVLQTLVELLNEKMTPTATIGLLEETVRRIVDNPPPQMLYQWSSLAISQRLVLSALATVLRRGDTFEGYEKVESLIDTLPGGTRRKLVTNDIRVELEALRTSRILDRDQTRYRFSIDLFRRWIQQEQNVWAVLSQARGVVP